MRNLLLVITSLILIVSCSNETEVKTLSNKIIELSKKKDFKEIYPLLTSDDQASISKDSFYIKCYKRYEDLDGMGYISFIDESFESLSDDTAIVKHIISIPDDNLIINLKREDESIKEAILRMMLSDALPTKEDTVKLWFIKEDGEFKYKAGCSEEQTYFSLRNEMERKFNDKNVDIEPIKIVQNLNVFSDNGSAKIYMRATNKSNYLISAISSDLVVDGKFYKGPYPGYIYFGEDLDPYKSVDDYTYISREVSKSLAIDHDDRTIAGNRIELIVRSIYFPEGNPKEHELYQTIFNKSGVEISTLKFLSQVAGLHHR